MKKASNNKDKTMTVGFDLTKDNKFMADIELGPNVVEGIHFTIDVAENGNLTYDEVESAAYAEADKYYSVKNFPNLTVKQLYVSSTDANSYCPIVSESDKKAIKKLSKSKEYDRYLVLPDATYSLTPEAELWMTLQEQGINTEDAAFDFDKMHAILESVSKIYSKLSK